MGKCGGFSFKYFTKDKKFTKEHIIRELGAIQNSKLYLPDDVNPKSLTRDYLFTIILLYNFF